MRSVPKPGQPARRKRRRRHIVLLTVLLLLAVPATSLARAMTYPGTAPASVRAVDWVRDHGGGPVVDFIETKKYSRDAPPSTGAPSDRLATATSGATSAVGTADALPRVRVLADAGGPAGEGVWTVVRRSAAGPVLYTTAFRPDARHLPIVVAAALIPARRTSLHLVAGTREPRPGAVSPENARVPSSARPHLVAAFNAGFKTKDAHGGWYADGRLLVPLRKGDASLVIRRDGTARVGAWGRDITMTPDVAWVRQNLSLVVQNGVPDTGLLHNADGRWGTGRNQFQYTARSGIGTDAHGNLIYVAGQGLTLDGLGNAMSKVGIVTGMELDIHRVMVTFNAFDPVVQDGYPDGHRLLQSMQRPLDRYLVPDQRDFFYVTAR